jgi:crossover junction endodeoxyribonuclease RusA
MMSITIVVAGKPCAKNNKHRVHFKPGIGRHLTEEFKEFRTRVHAAWCQLRAKGAQPFGTQQVLVNLVAYWPTKRRVDIDAPIEPTLDALTYAGVWDDDTQVISLHVAKGYSKENPRVEIEIGFPMIGGS